LVGNNRIGKFKEDKTMTPEQRLEELGIELPSAPAPVASYVRTIRQGDCIYVSGQLPLKSGELVAVGKVGDAVSLENGAEAARQCAINAISALKAEVGELSRITRIIRVTGFVASDPSFTSQPQVVNGASDLFVSVFGEIGRHTRSAVGVASLPLDAPVEVEVIAGI
jgi:enamine deaminase RidA (YjgF/YER057c/UK114 family)